MKIVMPQRDLRRAGCVERRTSGSGSGQGKPTDGNTGRASLADFHHNWLNLPYPIEDMLAEARAYHVGWVIAHQNLAQLTPDLREGLAANARTKLYFACSPHDARELAAHMAPALSAHDLTHLGAYTLAARLVVGGAHTAAFTLRTRPLPAVTQPGRRQRRTPHPRRVPQPRRAPESRNDPAGTPGPQTIPGDPRTPPAAPPSTHAGTRRGTHPNPDVATELGEDDGGFDPYFDS